MSTTTRQSTALPSSAPSAVRYSAGHTPRASLKATIIACIAAAAVLVTAITFLHK